MLQVCILAATADFAASVLEGTGGVSAGEASATSCHPGPRNLVPFQTNNPQVQISEFKERPGAKDYVAATILVERPGQRGILLGAGGAALKRLGAAARRDAEEFLGRPVYLEISVQVAPDWRHSGDRLKEYGYFDPLYVS